MHAVLEGDARAALTAPFLQHPNGENRHDEDEQINENEDGEADANHGGARQGAVGVGAVSRAGA